MRFDDITDWARSSGLEIVLIILGGLLLTRVARWVVATAPSRLHRDDKHSLALAQAISWLATATIWLLSTLLILQRFNVPLTGLVPPATVAGVAVGFGAQKIVADLLSGFFLFAERQLGYGDIVQVSQPGTTTGVSGTVEELTLRTTRLRTLSGEVVFIPNGEIRQLTNLSMDWARAVIDVPLSSSVDLDLAIDLLRETGKIMKDDPEWTSVLLDDPVVMGVETLDVGYLRVRLLMRTRPAEQFDAARELRRRVADALRGAGITPVAPIVGVGVAQ
ncbi:MAG: mechanosensitive ion channel [Acidimicrobiia bacterium]|nr:mechanosensitive ion channel [Acidimicrobiia bacterium]